jgi:hypothetical protein
MRRLHLFEFEDQPWFPALLRGYMTDYLAFTASLARAPFRGIARKLKAAMEASGTRQIVDLCSGGGGPVPNVVRLLREEEHFPVTVCLTDLHPNLAAFQRVSATDPSIQHVASPVDATAVPPEFLGFRTLFNGFHHLTPEQGRKVLEDAARADRGIAVVEMIDRSLLSAASVFVGSAAILLMTPFMRPFRLSRLLLTYAVPAVPLFALWDGLVSCLRIYSPDELRALADGIGADKGYRWEAGRLRMDKGPGGITFLIGIPRRA